MPCALRQVFGSASTLGRGRGWGGGGGAHPEQIFAVVLLVKLVYTHEITSPELDQVWKLDHVALMRATCSLHRWLHS